MSRCDPDPRYATYTGEVRAQAVRDLLHEAQQYEREGLPLSAAVYRECAAELDAAASATAEGLRRIGVAVAVWAGMAQTDARYESAREFYMAEIRRVRDMYLDQYGKRYRAQCAADRAKADLAAERAARRKWELRLRWRAENSYEQRYPNLDDIDRLYRHEVCAQRDPQKNTERLGSGISGITRFRWYFDAARRLPIAGPRGEVVRLDDRGRFRFPANYRPRGGLAAVWTDDRDEAVWAWLDADNDGRWCGADPLEPLEVVQRRIELGA